MNIEKLEVGKSFKNYKELCAELGLEVKTSTNSKKAQFRILDTYCRYSKIGHSITIEEIYGEPIEILDNRGKSEGTRLSKSIYGELIQLLILDMLANSDKGSLSISRGFLISSIDMANNNYRSCREHLKKLSKYTGIEESVIYDFYNISGGNFRKTLETSLKNLADKSIINVDTATKIKERKTNIHRYARVNEIEEIISIQREILDDMGFEKLSNARISSDWNRFKKEVTKALHERTSIDYYYSTYEIVANRGYLERERKNILDFLLNTEERKEYKNELNSLIRKNLLKNAEKRHENGFLSSGKDFRMKNGYVSSIEDLIELLVNNTTKDILKDITNAEEEAREVKFRF